MSLSRTPRSLIMLADTSAFAALLCVFFCFSFQLMAEEPASFAQTAPASSALHLIPIPRQVQPGPLEPIPQGLRITCTSCFSDPADNFTSQDFAETLAARSISTSGPFTITLTRVTNLPAEMQPEGYTITPGPNTLTLSAATSTGLFYATQTLKQLIEGDGSVRRPPPRHGPRLARHEVPRPPR